MSRAASVGARLGLVVCSGLLLLGIGELVSRTLLTDPREQFIQSIVLEAGDLRKGRDPNLPVLRGLLALARPNTLGIFKGVLYKTNRLGFRGPEYRATAPEGVFRIAITGDSYTMGSGVREEEAYPAQLEVLLNQDRSGRRYQVINVGLAGIAGSGAINRLKRAMDAYSPQLLVYGFTINDIEGPHYLRLVSAQRQIGWWDRARNSRSHLWRQIWPRMVWLWEALRPDDLAYARELEKNYFENPRAWGDMARALDRYAELGRRAGVCTHLLLHLHLDDHLGRPKGSHPFHRIYDYMAEQARERGISSTDPWPRLAGREPRALWVGRFDSHPNREGHRILAEALWEGLRALPSSCWNAAHRNELDRSGRHGPA